MDVTALGELLIDFATLERGSGGYPTMKANPGGAPGNFLAALAAYGAKTAMIAKVGVDFFGALLKKTIGQAGIETRGIIEDSKVFTTLAFVTFDAAGERSFSFARKPGADTCLTWEEVDRSLMDESRIFHFGSLSLTNSPAREATVQAVAYAKEKGKQITFDPNLRLPLWPSHKAAREQILWGLTQADVVKLSDEEATFLWGCTPEEAAEKLIREFHVCLAMITMGPRGCFLRSRVGEAACGCPKGNPVDTTGAGDIFGGAALSRLLKLEKEPGQLTDGELRSIGRFASAAASLSTQRLGGIPSIPGLDEVLAAVREMEAAEKPRSSPRGKA